MSYRGARLAPWFDRGPTHLALERMAEHGAVVLTEEVRSRTPVGDSGHLKASWKPLPVVIVANELGEVVYESGTESSVDYAPYVEHGTGLFGPKHAKYLIEPKKPGGVLHWIGKDGQDVFATRVWHPGSPGQHMVAISVGIVEAQLPLIVAGILEEWSKETEDQNHTGIAT